MLQFASGRNHGVVAIHKVGVTLEVRNHGNQNVDGHNHKRESAEPVRATQLAPLVLDDHKANAAGKRGVYLGIVEPTALIDVRGIGKRLLRTLRDANANGNAVDGYEDGESRKEDESADFAAALDLVAHDETHEQKNPAKSLHGRDGSSVRSRAGTWVRSSSSLGKMVTVGLF